jgi:[ribosomal protein S18]-alanine N-acetyltransferase
MTTLIEGQDRYFVRRMRESDLGAVRAIETLSFSNPWSDNTFRGEIQNTSISSPLVVVRRTGHPVVADNPVVADEEVVAYIIYWQIRDDVQINNVAVHPDCRGQGLGEAMMRYALAKVRAAGASFVTLEVRQSNASAVNLYKKLGFDILGTRKHYYTNPDEDAHVMGLVLDQ